MAAKVAVKEVKTKKAAEKAVERMLELQDEIAEIRKESGLDQRQAELDAAKEAVRDFMLEKELDRIDVPGAHLTLVKQFYGATYIGTEDDLDKVEVTGDVVPLRQIIRDKYGAFTKGSKSSEIWNKVTERIVVNAKVEEVVAEGLLSAKEIAPSFVEKAKKPFVRLFGEE